MGKLSSLSQLVMCGARYQKFDASDSGDHSWPTVEAKKGHYFGYNCSECGHRGKIRAEELNLVVENTWRCSNKLNNSLNLHKPGKCINHQQNEFGANVNRLVNNLHDDESKVKSDTLMTRINIFANTGGGTTTDNIKTNRNNCFPNKMSAEDVQLKCSPWFQPGLSREIASEVLMTSPTGSFLVRQSVSRPDCFALSVRVPSGGIVHYLIIAQQDSSKQRRYHIKGSNKMFPNLVSLVVHHSVMAELLPCPLTLKGTLICAENEEEDSRKSADFADTDLSDYPSLVLTLRKTIASSSSSSSSDND